MKISEIIFCLTVAISSFTLTSCPSTGQGAGLTAIENLSEQDFNKWKLYVQLGVKIGANRLVEENKTSQEELVKIADCLDMILSQPLSVIGQNLLQKALQDSGIKNDELALILAIAENEILARSGYVYTTEDGLVNLTPRTRDLLLGVSNALRMAGKVQVTPAELNFIETQKLKTIK
jgi:hypothetical protein